jgi:hypothetical protein
MSRRRESASHKGFLRRKFIAASYVALNNSARAQRVRYYGREPGLRRALKMLADSEQTGSRDAAISEQYVSIINWS